MALKFTTLSPEKLLAAESAALAMWPLLDAVETRAREYSCRQFTYELKFP